MSSRDLQIRLAAFQWLTVQMELHGEALPRTVLARGFDYEGTRVPLLNPQGIFKPAILDVPLSITTIPGGPYDDQLGSASGVITYRYRGTDPQHRDNRGLREAMRRQIPLIYFYRLQPGQYLATFPVYIVGDHPADLAFDVQVDDVQQLFAPEVAAAPAIAEDRAEIRREYVTAVVRRRLHQQAFRARVLEAYRTQCALCRLRHQELLDAAHIIGDAQEQGDPVVSNGLSLCKLHHAAFDRHFLTVRPDYRIEVRQSVLDEEDGPMLLHGLKEMHERLILLPSNVSLQPDRDRLAQRYQAFRAAI
ncbi:MAG TPA: HNH endonuclease [candidate division Zixibacteria bacterium]|nr:HNH endonuclease [candidate division Zixibacteria bacterium]